MPLQKTLQLCGAKPRDSPGFIDAEQVQPSKAARHRNLSVSALTLLPDGNFGLHEQIHIAACGGPSGAFVAAQTAFGSEYFIGLNGSSPKILISILLSS